MKCLNSEYVYKRLRRLHGNSFHNLIESHSIQFSEDDGNKLEILRSKSKSHNSSLNIKDDIDEQLTSKRIVDNIIVDYFSYLTPGYLHYEERLISSEEVQERVERLAQKIVKNIIQNKRKDI